MNIALVSLLRAELIIKWTLTLLVYRKGADAFVSGVAQYHDHPFWIVPVDPNLRWDTVLDPNGLVDIPVMSQPAVDGIHGFVLHDACWCLLQTAGGASAFSKERLVEVCQSLPFTVWFNGVSWGHDYGGRLKLDTKVWYPWKETFRALEYEKLERLGFLEDPFRGSDLKLAPNGRFPASHASKDDASNFNASLEPRGRGDCFSRLPWELREMILIHLETKDALNLRQSSWSFQFLFQASVFGGLASSLMAKGVLYLRRGMKQSLTASALFKVSTAVRQRMLHPNH